MSHSFCLISPFNNSIHGKMINEKKKCVSLLVIKLLKISNKLYEWHVSLVNFWKTPLENTTTQNV